MAVRVNVSLLFGGLFALTAAAEEPRVIESDEPVDEAEVLRILERPALLTQTRSIRKVADSPDASSNAFALRVEFALDSAAIPPRAARQLDSIAAAVQRLSGEPLIRIEGHTDALGTDAYNAALSQRRAEAVREYLVARGVPESRLQARGLGDSAPLVAADPDDARNRRVEFRRVDGG